MSNNVDEEIIGGEIILKIISGQEFVSINGK